MKLIYGENTGLNKPSVFCYKTTSPQPLRKKSSIIVATHRKGSQHGIHPLHPPHRTRGRCRHRTTKPHGKPHHTTAGTLRKRVHRASRRRGYRVDSDSYLREQTRAMAERAVVYARRGLLRLGRDRLDQFHDPAHRRRGGDHHHHCGAVIGRHDPRPLRSARRDGQIIGWNARVRIAGRVGGGLVDGEIIF